MSEPPELTPEDVKEILRLVDDSHFDEFELETPRFTIRFRRDGAPETATPAGPVPAMPVRAMPVPAVPVPAPGLVEVTSPMVGTFYRSPAPGDPPFVEVGARVEDESPVGIVEVMKLLNRVTAGVEGVVVEICRGDAESVQYGDVLFLVRPGA